MKKPHMISYMRCNNATNIETWNDGSLRITPTLEGPGAILMPNEIPTFIRSLQLEVVGAEAFLPKTQKKKRRAR